MEKKRKKIRSLCRSHMRQLRKVSIRLAHREKMDGSKLVLCEENKETIDEAKKLINKAIILLLQVK